MESTTALPSLACESIAFWMTLERRLGKIEHDLDELRDGIFNETLALARQLRTSRVALQRAIEESSRSRPRKERTT